MHSLLTSTVRALQGKKRILFLTTSNRWSGESGGEEPKTTMLAKHMAYLLGKEKVTHIDAGKLLIFPCEGNVSTARGNTCGLQEAVLKDTEKNPSGHHRCWASLNNPTDELWKISKEILLADAVIFFTSVRWGQTNSIHQKLIERLTWLENRHSTLKEQNILTDISTGIIISGHNWHGKEVLQNQIEVLRLFGFKVEPALCWNWQYTDNFEDESQQSYQDAAQAFKKDFLL